MHKRQVPLASQICLAFDEEHTIIEINHTREKQKIVSVSPNMIIGGDSVGSDL